MKSRPITPPPLAASAVALPVPCPCPHHHSVTLVFLLLSCLPWLVIASPLVTPFLSHCCLLTRSLLPLASHSPRLVVQSLLLLPPLPHVPSSCATTSHQRTYWFLRCLSSCRLRLASALLMPPPPAMRRLAVALPLTMLPFVCVSKGQATMRRRHCPH